MRTDRLTRASIRTLTAASLTAAALAQPPTSQPFTREIRRTWPVTDWLVARVNTSSESIRQKPARLTPEDVLITDLREPGGREDHFQETLAIIARANAERAGRGLVPGAPRPALVLGSYLNPHNARKRADQEKDGVPKASLAYEDFPRAAFKTEYKTGKYSSGSRIDRAWFDLGGPQGERILERYLEEARRRPGSLIMLDNCSNSLNAWDVRTGHYARISAALAEQGKLTIGNFGRAAAPHALTPTEVRDLEASLHGLMFEHAFPPEARDDVEKVRRTVEALRFWTGARMCVVMLPLGEANTASELAALATMIKDDEHPCVFVSWGITRATPEWALLPRQLGAPLGPPEVRNTADGPAISRRYARGELTLYTKAGRIERR